ncbi:MAG TPA: phosphopantetheine-binding protein, partial [Pyrinomonadaceae bacterium]
GGVTGAGGVSEVLRGAAAEELAGRVRAGLRSVLPEYMAPGEVVALSALPINRSGKIDYQALPEAKQGRGEGVDVLVEAGSEVERVLAEIWAEVLELERVSVKGNFFELGGQSLLAARVTTQVRARLNVELTVYDLFEQPTIADLARHIETILWTARDLQQAPHAVAGEALEEGDL